jgi:dsDNA-specific endonuclease/ATPase MutS2
VVNCFCVLCARTMSESDDNPFHEPVEIEITDSFDLHSFAPRDIRAVVEAYLSAAHKKGFTVVRLIHGKGVGVQREIVRKVLSETDFVRDFKNAPEFSGSWGATIVEFEV